MRIENSRQLNRWLEQASHQEVLTFSSIACAQALPLVIVGRKATAGIYALRAMRCLLTVMVRTRSDFVELRKAAREAAEHFNWAVEGFTYKIPAMPANNFGNSIDALMDQEISLRYNRYRIKSSLTSPQSFASSAFMSMHRDFYGPGLSHLEVPISYGFERSVDIATKVACIIRDSKFEDVWQHGLWPVVPPLHIWVAITDFLDFLADDLSTWEFWNEWYRLLLVGCIPNWDLWLKVALIEDDTWFDGPEAIAEQIQLIRESN